MAASSRAQRTPYCLLHHQFAKRRQTPLPSRGDLDLLDLLPRIIDALARTEYLRAATLAQQMLVILSALYAETVVLGLAQRAQAARDESLPMQIQHHVDDSDDEPCQVKEAKH